MLRIYGSPQKLCDGWTRREMLRAGGNAVGTADAITRQLALVQEQERATVESFRLADLQYREGTIDITTLLNTQSQMFNAQLSLVNTKLARLQNSINLYIALGGGWTQKQSDADYKPSLDWYPLAIGAPG